MEEEKALINFLEMTTGKTLKMTKLVKALELINEQMESWGRARDLIARTVPCPVTLRDQLSMYQIMWHRGTARARDFIKSYYEEVKDRVENYRPGFLKRVGFDYPVMKEINPRIILTSISGYGQTGPYSQRAAYDSVGQAMGGLMSVTGPADLPPMDAGAAVCDITAGIFGALGTMFALYHQKETGIGQHVDASLVESIVFLMGLNLSLHNVGRAPKKGELLSPTRTPGAGMFLTKDGVWLIIMAQTNQHWPTLARLIDREDLAVDPDYRSRNWSSRHGVEISKLLESWVSNYTIDEAETILDKAGLPFGRVQNLEEVLKDPHLEARKLFHYFEFEGKKLPMIAPYPILSKTPGSIHSLWPSLGQHNDEIYKDLLGYSPEEIEAFKQEGVI